MLVAEVAVAPVVGLAVVLAAAPVVGPAVVLAVGPAVGPAVELAVVRAVVLVAARVAVPEAVAVAAVDFERSETPAARAVRHFDGKQLASAVAGTAGAVFVVGEPSAAREPVGDPAALAARVVAFARAIGVRPEKEGVA